MSSALPPWRRPQPPAFPRGAEGAVQARWHVAEAGAGDAEATRRWPSCGCPRCSRRCRASARCAPSADGAVRDRPQPARSRPRRTSAAGTAERIRRLSARGAATDSRPAPPATAARPRGRLVRAVRPVRGRQEHRADRLATRSRTCSTRSRPPPARRGRVRSTGSTTSSSPTSSSTSGWRRASCWSTLVRRQPVRHAGDAVERAARRPARTSCWRSSCRVPGRSGPPRAGREAVLMFLAPPSFDELARRLIGRGTEERPTGRPGWPRPGRSWPPRRSSITPWSTRTFDRPRPAW